MGAVAFSILYMVLGRPFAPGFGYDSAGVGPVVSAYRQWLASPNNLQGRISDLHPVAQLPALRQGLGTRVVCSIRVAGGCSWDLQGAVAGGAAAELETWSLLPAVCPTRWKQLSVLGHCRSEHKLSLCLGYSWCLSGRKNMSLDSYPRFIPRFIPFCCHLQPRTSCALGSASEAMPPKSSEDTKFKEKHCRNQLAALFAEVRQKRWVRKAYCDVSSATRYTTCERP